MAGHHFPVQSQDQTLEPIPRCKSEIYHQHARLTAFLCAFNTRTLEAHKRLDSTLNMGLVQALASSWSLRLCPNPQSSLPYSLSGVLQLSSALLPQYSLSYPDGAASCFNWLYANQSQFESFGRVFETG